MTQTTVGQMDFLCYVKAWYLVGELLRDSYVLEDECGVTCAEYFKTFQDVSMSPITTFFHSKWSSVR